uniref:Uncharacterized protein n=1 Tax=viral metagenome TaxID=1070528 RepID=A0A6H1ZRU2_9ZZZZ
MANRYKTSRLVSSPSARLAQIKVERERGLVQAEVGTIGQIGQILKPVIDHEREHYELIKRVTPGPGDVIFDRFAIIATDKGAFIPLAGTQTVIYTYRVPAGQKVIMNQYCFFVMIDERPANQHPICAAPLELFTWLSTVPRADFLILANGTVPGDLAYAWSTVANVMIVREGFTCLTENPNEASNPNHGGMALAFPSGTLIQVIFRNYTYAYAQAGTRKWGGLGCRLRGFLSPVNPEEK